MSNPIYYQRFMKSACKGKSMKTSKWQVSTQDITLGNGKVIPAGAEYKAFESTNFGWLIFAPGTRTQDGYELQPSERMLKY